MDAIEQVRYAPPGEYVKDHCLIRHDGLWHLFGISGQIGHSWMNPGNEECISHSTSPDLAHWQMHGHPVQASHRAGYYDEHMAVAPFVIRDDDGRFCMFYSGWQHPNKRPHFNLDGHRQTIYMAISDDLYRWEIPDEIAPRGIRVTEGGPIVGRDPHVLRDDAASRWLLYYTEENLGRRPFRVGVADSQDLKTWRHLGAALIWPGDRRPFDPCESPFVLKHPRSGQFILFLNWDYCISDNPLKFAKPHPLPFPSGLDYPPPAIRGSGAGWCSVGVGFAREFIEHEGNYYMSGVVGRDGEMKLGFTRFSWTTNFLTLNANP